MKIYYVDGEFVSSKKAMIPVDDLSVLRGYGVCDIMRTYQGRPYFLNEHIARLEHSASKIGLTLPWDTDKIKGIVLETLERNQIQPEADGPSQTLEANVRIVITGGSSPDFLNPVGSPRLIVLVTPIKKLPRSWYTNGVKVITVDQERSIPGAKVTSYIPAALALKKAGGKNAVEAIYVNALKEALEGTTSNLFAFFGTCLVTPEKDVLKGITRKLILDLASGMFEVEKRKIRLEDLVSANEVFISGTNKGVVPVIQINDTIIGSGQPGENTLRIMAALDNHAREFQEK